MSFSVSYSSNIVCITPWFDVILSEKSGRGFSRFYFCGIKASAVKQLKHFGIRKKYIHTNPGGF